MSTTLTEDDGRSHIRLAGPLTVAEAAALARTLGALPADRDATVDLGDAGRMDTAGAWAIAMLQARLEAAGHALHITGADERRLALLDTVAGALPKPDPALAPARSLTDRLDAIGRAVAAAGTFFVEITAYLGLFLARLGRSLIRPREFRLTALVHHCQDVGWAAVPIVALMSFLIGIVLAFQGASQLRQFGAEIFVVDLIAISMLRELGILLTAIIVAGRTASAFTAAIGSMKMREEIDAMTTLGIDPAQVLFVPRILALILMLPILGLIANLSGLIGGALMSWIELGISPALFQARLRDAVSIDHAIVGLVKAPVFALIIGVIGCHAGMKVGSSAESLGRMTSAAVVAAIFSVIVAAALFSVFFAQVGL
ncbi:MAG: MlaE family lipid ABC transporter permease subunit [Alkalilacustris sp.]